MGLNLSRENFMVWVERHVPRSYREGFLNALAGKIGNQPDWDRWDIDDDSYERIGSYATYGILVLCFEFLVRGDFGDGLERDEEMEREALAAFRKWLRPASAEIPGATHLLDSSDYSTIFVPARFASPLEFQELYVSSAPVTVEALGQLLRILEEVVVPENPNQDGQKWSPLHTAQSVAQHLQRFLKEKPDSCVVFE